MIEITQDRVVYASRTKLLELAYEIAQTRNLVKVKSKIDQAAKIRIWLKALDYETYLDRSQKERIWYELIKIANINDLPTSPTLGTVAPPTLYIGIQGPRGFTGPRGEDGGATDFSKLNQVSQVAVDEFPVTDTRAARWDYIIFNDTNQRSGAVICSWLGDGLTIASPAEYSDTDIGDTSPVTFTVDYSGGNIRLVANITSGTWSIRGSRYFIPNNGAGTGIINTELENGKIFIGNSSNVATGRAISGDITLSNTGVVTIPTGTITDDKISVSANISVQKLEALTASKVAITDSNGKFTTSDITPTKIGYLTDVTSNIQAQLDGKLSAATGAISTVVSSNLTPSRVTVSDASGKIAASTVSTTTLGYISTLTSDAQAQLDSKQPLISGGGASGGTYTPTATILSNLSSVTPNTFTYMRVGPGVAVWGSVTVDPVINSAQCSFRLSLPPIASNFSSDSDCVGDVNSIVVSTNEHGIVQTDTSNDQAIVDFIANNTASHGVLVKFFYRVI